MPSAPTRWPAYRRLPEFVPVPARARADGWTPARQGDFIGFLAESGSVAEAARQVGLTRESAYKLRRRAGAESFAAAWDAAAGGAASGQGDGRHLSAPRKFTADMVAERALGVTLQVLMRRGRYVGTRRKTSDRLLLRLLARLDRLGGEGFWGEGDGVTHSAAFRSTGRTRNRMGGA